MRGVSQPFAKRRATAAMPATPLRLWEGAAIPMTQVHRILQGAWHQGLETERLLTRVGIAPERLAKPQAQVSVRRYARLVGLLRRETRDELWGLCSRRVPLGSFALATRLMVGCDTLGQALREGCHFYHLLLDDFALRLVVRDDRAHLRIIPREPMDARQAYAQRTVLFFALGVASWLVERRLPLLRVHLGDGHRHDGECPLGADMALNAGETARLFQAPVVAGQGFTELVFAAEWLEHPIRQDATSLQAFLRDAPRSLLVKYRNEASLTERVRAHLRRNLADSLPSLDEVAQVFGLSPQTLRRRLKESGKGFQCLKDEVRRDVAIDCLARADLPLMEVASRVGFSEPSTFHRAFKKWTGLAPGTYRERVLEVPALAFG